MRCGKPASATFKIGFNFSPPPRETQRARSPATRGGCARSPRHGCTPSARPACSDVGGCSQVDQTSPSHPLRRGAVSGQREGRAARRRPSCSMLAIGADGLGRAGRGQRVGRPRLRRGGARKPRASSSSSLPRSTASPPPSASSTATSSSAPAGADDRRARGAGPRRANEEAARRGARRRSTAVAAATTDADGRFHVRRRCRRARTWSRSRASTSRARRRPRPSRRAHARRRPTTSSRRTRPDARRRSGRPRGRRDAARDREAGRLDRGSPPTRARRVPGTQGDVLKVVENLPGVARASIGSGQLVVWGVGAARHARLPRRRPAAAPLPPGRAFARSFTPTWSSRWSSSPGAGARSTGAGSAGS